MPRGRHRHSPPLHRLLPPSAVAGASVLCAAGAWLLADPLGLRLLVAAAAAAAVTGAVLMRSWDRAAGRRVAELTRARAGDQWKTEERIADLEADLEEARELRAKLDAKLRAKRVELAGLRNEHAELLRRYATAETQRASALEGRRRLALGATAPGARGTGGTAGAPAGGAPASGGAPAVTSAAPAKEDYLRAARALDSLARNAAEQKARRSAEPSAGRPADRPADRPAGPVAGVPGAPAGAIGPAGSPAGTAGSSAGAVPGPVGAAPGLTGPVSGTAGPTGPTAGPTGPTAGPTGPTAGATGTSALAMRPVPAAATIVPYAARRRPVPRPSGSFDFFGTRKAAPAPGGDTPGGDKKKPAAIEAAVQDEDLADVVGEEALAEAGPAGREAAGRAVGEVIDLTAHDETEQLDVAGLRDAVGS
ncbi:coiled-coil domain-containing protein [Streptomyces sp. SS162]|uniref:coiled-coil domain-containing protein n=1 Tax=Streptomyces sp. SS162 TaxID=3108484 RepID=UPI002F3E65EA